MCPNLHIIYFKDDHRPAKKNQDNHRRFAPAYVQIMAPPLVLLAEVNPSFRASYLPMINCVGRPR
jgi:hypothetical protein